MQLHKVLLERVLGISEEAIRNQTNVEYLRKRHAALLHSPLFQGMEFSTDPARIAQWIPLVMDGRAPALTFSAKRV